jgi:ferritin-like metal-binding protein YciE
MSQAEQKVVQYLNEAHATELGLVNELQAQIAMTPQSTYRTGLEKHLEETRRHAERVQERLGELGGGRNPLLAGLGVAEAAVNQVIALWRAPFTLLRGTSGDEKVLRNARDSAASEALEIATYTALERVARSVGDEKTAALARSIRADEERMLERVMREIPKLADRVVQAEVHGSPSYDVTETGAADAAREAGDEIKGAAREAASRTRDAARQARKVPGVAQVEGEVKGAVATADDLPIARYDSLTAAEVVGKLNELSQIDLAKVDAYERKNQNRSTVLGRIDALRGEEPWPGYDELTASEIRASLGELDDERAKAVRAYERSHKNRSGVLSAVERELANA